MRKHTFQLVKALVKLDNRLKESHEG